MANFTQSRTFQTSQYPVHAVQTSGLLRRVEPPLTPELFFDRYLLGIPFQFIGGNPFTPEILKDRIMMAMNETEAQLGTTIYREEFQDKLPFDYSLYKSFIHLKPRHSPIVSLERVAIVASNDEIIFVIPSVWMDMSNASIGQLNCVPLLSAFGATSTTGTPITALNQGAGVAFLAIWGSSGSSTNIPAYWQVNYSAGLSNIEGQIPVIVNQLIGTNAAINIISQIATLFLTTSQSQSQDGISQSSSWLGPRAFQLRIEELMANRDELIAKIKGIFAKKYVIGEY
jgi:hypothetical protein